MTKKKVSVEIAPNVSVDMGLDASHIADILIANEEDRLHKQEKALQGALKDLEKEVDNLEKNISEEIDKIVQKNQELKKIQVTEAIKALDMKAKDIKKVEGQSSPRGKKLAHTIHVEVANDNQQHVFSFCFATAVPKGVKSLKEKLDKTCEQISGTKKEIIEVKQQLGNMDAIERRARGRIAAQVLSGSAEGQKLLKDILPNNKVLPAPTE